MLSGALLALAFAAAPAAAAGDTKGPACADIVDGGGLWDGSTITFQIKLAKPACRSVTYTLYATTTDPDVSTGTVVSTSDYTLDADGNLIFSLPIADPDPATPCSLVYVYATTAIRGHVADVAPDAGYLQLPDDPGCGSGSKAFH